ncbi:MAG: Ig-like domain-containing protein [Firmicutes bacterium]|nr:Ig-like domain-containing protein [Bacillota bacterium]
MKRRFPALLIALALILAAASAVFADSLTIVDISPSDGSKGYQPANMAVKIRFSEDMMDESAIAANKNKFSITDPDGAEQAYDIVYNADKYPDELWLVLQEDLQANTEYKVTVQPGIVSSSGSKLADGMTVTFQTRNVRTDGLISMGLMVVLMVAMFGMTARAARKEQEKDDPRAAERAIEDSLNPYKLAKQKGISLAEAQAIVDKEKDKLEKKKAKAEADRIRREEMKAEERRKMEEELEFFGTDNSELKKELRAEGIYLVKGPKSVKEAGGRVPRSVRRHKEAKRRKAAEKAKNAQKNKKKK